MKKNPKIFIFNIILSNNLFSFCNNWSLKQNMQIS